MVTMVWIAERLVMGSVDWRQQSAVTYGDTIACASG